MEASEMNPEKPSDASPGPASGDDAGVGAVKARGRVAVACVVVSILITFSPVMPNWLLANFLLATATGILIAFVQSILNISRLISAAKLGAEVDINPALQRFAYGVDIMFLPGLLALVTSAIIKWHWPGLTEDGFWLVYGPVGFALLSLCGGFGDFITRYYLVLFTAWKKPVAHELTEEALAILSHSLRNTMLVARARE